MGSIGEELLKLTEFPFSYSLIGLLALIFGGPNSIQDLGRLAPMLIVMGFVATTLSICDPIGVAQKRLLLLKMYNLGRMGLRIENSDAQALLNIGIFGRRLRSTVSVFLVICTLSNYQSALSRIKQLRNKLPGTPKLLTIESNALLEVLTDQECEEIFFKIKSLKDGAVRTKWVRAEVDKITAMAYFVTVVSVFIAAEFLLPNFLDKLIGSFGGGQGPKTAILAFSIVALAAVSIMLVHRLKELETKTRVAFRFLIEVDAVKVEKQAFDKSLQEIERYLNGGDWTMAEYWSKRVSVEYEDYFRTQGLEIQ